MDEATGWTTVRVRTRPELVEVLSDALWAFGPAAVEERSGDGVTLLLAGFEDPSRAADAAAAVGARTDVDRADVEVTSVVDDGLDAWRRFARPERAGPFLLVPAWQDLPEGAATARTVRLDPGRTFGSGSHPTTRLVLTAVADLVRPGDAVLDVGTGSGVLAVAAALVGAALVEAIDPDPASPATATENALRNGVEDRVRASDRELSDVAAAGGRFDLVLANLLGPLVEALAPDLLAATRPGGHLVVSGLLDEQSGRIRTTLTVAAARAGRTVTVLEVRTEEGWDAIVLRC